MIRRPPRPTLFPYTTLFRSDDEHEGADEFRHIAVHPLLSLPNGPPVLLREGFWWVGDGQPTRTPLDHPLVPRYPSWEWCLRPDRKSTRLTPVTVKSRMPSSA